MIAAVLSAGESKRFGRCKQVELINGMTMIETVVRALPRGLDVIVITGAYEDLVTLATQHLSITAIHNSNYKNGIGSSVKCAARYARSQNSDLLITLADLPFVTEIDYSMLIEQLKDRPVFSSFQQQLGPPAIFPAHSLDTLITIEDTRGAKSVFNDVHSVPINNALRDIDCLQDLESLKI